MDIADAGRVTAKPFYAVRAQAQRLAELARWLRGGGKVAAGSSQRDSGAS